LGIWGAYELFELILSSLDGYVMRQAIAINRRCHLIQLVHEHPLKHLL
jgi:hypothetical protein